MIILSNTYEYKIQLNNIKFLFLIFIYSQVCSYTNQHNNYLCWFNSRLLYHHQNFIQTKKLNP